MRKAFLVAVLILAGSFSACRKQQTEQERRAEVEREVQQRLAAERQQQLDQRQAELNAREQSLRENANKSVATQTRETAAPAESEAPEQTSAGDQQRTGSYSIFYSKLEPYGDWLETNNYGYVYHPREASNARWRPYTNGRWVYTDAGWNWISDEPFGWATYHYGRWTRIRDLGWVWVPGNEWAPAWVSWRKGGEYVGWAPLPPEAQFDRRRGIHNWSDSYYDVGPDQYVFVPVQQFGEERIERAIVPQPRIVTIVNQTTNVTNITYNNTMVVNQGPNYDELKQQSRVPIPRLRVEQQASITTNQPRSVIRGDVVEVPAPVITSVRPSDRPRVVKQKITQAAVDLGWAAIDNPREAEQTRAKIKAEATPPADVPPKSAVDRQISPPPSTTALTPATTTTPLTSPALPEAGPRQTVFPARTQARPAATASAASRTPVASVGRMTPATSPSQGERGLSSPPSPPVSPMPPSTTPDRPATMDSTATAPPPPVDRSAPESSASPPEQRKKLKSVARQFEKQSTVPMPSASVTPGPASPAPENTASSPEPRRTQPRAFSNQSDMPSAAPDASGSATNPTTERPRRKNSAARPERSAAASPSGTPAP